MRKTIIISILCSLLFSNVVYGAQTTAAENAAVSYPIATNAIEGWPQGPEVTEETACLLEGGTGTVLYNKGMDEKRYPASITKIMTCLLILEKCNLEDKVTFTELGVRDVYSGSSNAGMQVGEILTVEQCLNLILIKSANEVSTQMAEFIAGSEQAFVDMMNQRAAELGCTNTHFNNANGLPDENHYTSAHDMALIGQEAIKNETFRSIISQKNYQLQPTNKNPYVKSYDTHHAMLGEDPTYQYPEAIGGKTGYTDSSLSTLITFAEKEDTLLVAVLMRGDGAQIVLDTKSLFEYGFRDFEKMPVTAQGDEGDSDPGYEIVPKGTMERLAAEEKAAQDKEELQKQKDGSQNQQTNDADSENGSIEKDTLPKDIMYIIMGVLGILIVVSLVGVVAKVRRRK